MPGDPELSVPGAGMHAMGTARMGDDPARACDYTVRQLREGRV